MKAWIWLSVDTEVVPAVPVLAALSAEGGGGGGGGMSPVERLVSLLVPADAVIDCSTVSSASIRLEAEIAPLVDAAAEVPEAAESVDRTDVSPAVPAAPTPGGGPGGGGGGASVAEVPSGPVSLSAASLLSDDPERRARKAIMADEVVLPVLSIDDPEAVLAAPTVPAEAVVALLASRSPFRSCAAIR